MRYLMVCTMLLLAAAPGLVMAQDDEPVGFGFPDPPAERAFAPETPGRADPQERLIAPPPQERRFAPPVESPAMSFELWSYIQEQKKLEDPRYQVYLRAAQKAEQRNRRLATAKWFGYSNTRPVASTIPIMGTYSPTWVGNSWNSFHWSGVAHPPVASINFGGVTPRR